MSLGLGLDTGGTYTDAVLFDMGRGAVIAKAKALTTRDDLAVGIGNSLRGFGPDALKNVSLVSLSSTLATNSIVEGKGCRVGLICMGREFDRSMDVDAYACVRGSHDISGKEKEPLDEASLFNALEGMRDKVDCVAVTGYMSVRNPGHEVRAAKAAAEMLKVPAVCGFQLSSGLGFNERAVTAVMNARLIPVIEDLIRSVRRVMCTNGIAAPLMIVRGNGSVMGESVALECPVETILSGPASSLTGARAMTGLDDAIVVDMGGTTTDIGVLRGGFPGIDREGATIGGYRTRVLAVEVSTSGMGGDSRIVIDGSKLHLMPLRVVPLCIAAVKWPMLMTKLGRLCEAPAQRQREAFDMRNVILEYEFFTASKTAAEGSFSECDARFLKLVREAPHSLSEAGAVLGVHPLSFNVAKMEEHGLIQRIGLTPTDILHAEGTYTEYCDKVSRLAVCYASSRVGMTECAFIDAVKRAVVDKLTDCVIRKLVGDEAGMTGGGAAFEDTLSKFITGASGRDYGCRFTANKPIVGIGAPADAWLPQVAERLGTDYVSPADHDVGNAVGAITGCVAETLDILIEPKGAFKGDDTPCTAYSKLGRFEFGSLSEAVERSKSDGEKFVAAAARNAGAAKADIKHDISRRMYGDNDGTELLMDIKVTVTAIGKPDGFTNPN